MLKYSCCWESLPSGPTQVMPSLKGTSVSLPGRAYRVPRGWFVHLRSKNRGVMILPFLKFYKGHWTHSHILISSFGELNIFCSFPIILLSFSLHIKEMSSLWTKFLSKTWFLACHCLDFACGIFLREEQFYVTKSIKKCWLLRFASDWEKSSSFWHYF